MLPGVTSTPNGTSNGLGFNFANIGVEGSPIGVGLNTNGTPYRGGTANLADGVDINDPGCNCWSIATMNPDMVQEVSVQTSNFGADVSHGPVVVNNISKSGTATYHGSAYFYGRNDASMPTTGSAITTPPRGGTPTTTIPEAISAGRSHSLTNRCCSGLATRAFGRTPATPLNSAPMFLLPICWQATSPPLRPTWLPARAALAPGTPAPIAMTSREQSSLMERWLGRAADRQA